MNTVNVFVDVEARGQSPVNGTMTEFGCVTEHGAARFHGRLFESSPDPANPAIPLVGKRIATDGEVARRLVNWLGEVTNNGRAIFVSDNNGYDFMWIAGMFDRAYIENPFGHSSRRISDFYAGLQHDWSQTQKWKKFRITPHDHNPVNDSLGNVEAFKKLQEIAEERRQNEQLLNALDAAGVDNWEGYDYAMEILRD